MFSPNDLPNAVVTAARCIKTQVPGAQIVVNFLIDLPGWRSKAERLLAATGTSIDVVGIDHYPGTWTVGSDKSWKAGVQALSEINLDLPGSVWSGRRLAIMETGYASNLSWLRGPGGQERFFLSLERALPRLQGLRSPPSFVGFYEICDRNSGVLLDPEAQFGILEDDCLTRKPAFAVARRISKAWRCK